MAHPKFGTKFTCFQCDVKFYDLGAPKPVCPKCGANQKKAPKKRATKSVKPPVEVDEFGAEEEPLEEELQDFPVKDEEEEAFDPNSDRLSIDGVPDQEF